MPRPMYFASFAKKVFLRTGRIDGTSLRRAGGVLGGSAAHSSSSVKGRTMVLFAKLALLVLLRCATRCGTPGRRACGAAGRRRVLNIGPLRRQTDSQSDGPAVTVSTLLPRARVPPVVQEQVVQSERPRVRRSGQAVVQAVAPRGGLVWGEG